MEKLCNYGLRKSRIFLSFLPSICGLLSFMFTFAPVAGRRLRSTPHRVPGSGEKETDKEWPRASHQEPKLPGSSTYAHAILPGGSGEQGQGEDQASTETCRKEKEEVPLIQRLWSGCHSLRGLRQHTFIFSHPGAWKSEVGVPAGLGSW